MALMPAHPDVPPCFNRRQALAIGVGGAASAWARRGFAAANTCSALKWGNINYLDFALGQKRKVESHEVTLLAATATTATVEAGGEQVTLPLARLALPQQVGPLRIFLADTLAAAKLTTDEGFPQHRRVFEQAAVLGVCRADQPLLDPKRFLFPIDRKDGFSWSMEEDSHQFAFISPQRSHEGIDFNLHDARGHRRHALVAIEDATVRWIEYTKTGPNEACVLLESSANRGQFYIYQHLNRHAVLVKPGAKVERGKALGYIWGDGIWGHLHFAVVGRGGAPGFSDRYRYLLNAFPALYELWHGDLNPRSRKHTQGDWIFDRNKAANGNRKYLGAYNPLLGYGWQVADFCPALKVEPGPERDIHHLDTSARLRKTLFEGTPAAAENPHNHYVFQIDVEAGVYEVQVRVGDRDLPTWQKLSINNTDLGTFERAPGFTWTPLEHAKAPEGKLLLRVDLQAKQLAAVSAINFRKKA